MSPSVNRQPGLRQGDLLLAGIIISLLAMEWNYSRPGYTLPLVLSYPGMLAGLIMPLLFFMKARFSFSLDANRMLKIFFILGLAFLLVLALQWLLHPEAAATYDLYLFMEFTALPLWGMAGYLYAADFDETRRLFGRFALCAAWGSLFSFGLRLADVPVTVPFGIAGWPVRLFFLFGFCWYLALFMVREKISRRTLAGLAACSLEVLVTLHKPIIWSALFLVATLLLAFRTHMPRRRFGRAMATLLKSAVAVGLLLMAVNGLFQGVVTKEINEFIYDRVLHITEENDSVSLVRASGSRLLLWQVALEDFMVSPWVGAGVKEMEFDEGTISMHNGYLDLLFIVGICGMIPVVFGVGIWLWRVVRSLGCAPLLLLQSCSLAYMVGILMYNFGGTSRLFGGVSYFIALICGISMRLAVDCHPEALQAAPCLYAKHGKFAGNGWSA